MATIKELDAKIENIRNNHLAHMAEDIDRIEGKVDKMDNRLWAVLVLIIASVIGVVFKGML
jgi:uncharacterized protein Yka (UPF0111/DUF47 family)